MCVQTAVCAEGCIHFFEHGFTAGHGTKNKLLTCTKTSLEILIRLAKKIRTDKYHMTRIAADVDLQNKASTLQYILDAFQREMER